MVARDDSFKEAATHWDLDRLYRDLAIIKQQSGKRHQLTPVEMACLRGLLCGYSPNEIATELKRELRGLRVDLCRGLYRYVETLTERPLNTLKDWRDVANWLMLSGYQVHSNNLLNYSHESLIKIVDITLDGSAQFPVIDIKVRNIGHQVAFLKKTRFQFYHVWVLKSWTVQPDVTEMLALPAAAPCRSVMKSRSVEPSFDYQIAINPDINDNAQEFIENNHTYTAEFIQLNSQSQFNSLVYSADYTISQCVAGNDVDRFTFTLSFPEIQYHDQCHPYNSYIYHFKLEIIYDEDNKSAESQDVVLFVESNDLSSDNRYFFEEDYRKEAQMSDFNADFRSYSEQNKAVLTQVDQIEGVKTIALNQLIATQKQQTQGHPSLFQRFIQKISHQ